MTVFKRAERQLKAAQMINGFRACDMKVKTVGEFCKWKEVSRGRIQMKMTVYEVKDARIGTSYFMADSLDMVACPLTASKEEVIEWLKSKEYKPVKQWYIEDYGMSEETWNIWNGNGEEEE